MKISQKSGLRSQFWDLTRKLTTTNIKNSEMYLGMKYMEIYDSGLLTKSEKEKLRKNNSILNDRELEKSFKGKISGKPKVEF